MTTRGEYDARLADMKANAAATSASMEAHIKADAEAFAALIAQLTEVNKDVKSIISSRAYALGMWKMATIMGGTVLGSIAVIEFWLRFFHA